MSDESKMLVSCLALVCVLCGWAIYWDYQPPALMTCKSLNLRIVPLPGDRSTVFCAEEADHE